VRLQFGQFVLDVDSRQLFQGEAEAHLQPKAFDLLELLVRSRPKALSKRYIRGHLWPDTVVGDASLTVLVAELRSALGDDAKEPRYIRTVYGFGYAFAGEVETEGQRPGASPPLADDVAPRVLWEKRVIPLVEGDNILGREDGVTVRIDAPGVSRRHALIRVAGGRATIEDLGSKNGTYVGDDPSPIPGPTALPHDSRFRLGGVRLVFRSSPEDGSTLTERRP
jgi:DNA-binding winged helix-turn-helix (wHTH) protein